MQGNQCEPTAHTLSCAGADRLAIRSIQLRVGEVLKCTCSSLFTSVIA